MENEYFKKLEEVGIKLTESQKKRIIEKLNKRLNYIPKIGVLGKTGVGKSSLCNALFGSDVYQISDVEACTRNPQEEILKISNGSLKLVDLPGIGENSERDKEYAELYNKIIPELDIILWILKADDRAFSSDELFYNNTVKHYLDDGKPFLFVVNQVDKIEPFREWNVEKHLPSDRQLLNINRKIENISCIFELPKSKIIPVSAEEKYHLSYLLEEIFFLLPSEEVIGLRKNIDNRILSSDAVKMAEEAAEDVVDTVIAEEIEDNGKANALVDKITDLALNGVSSIGFVSPQELANQYMRGNGSLDDKINSLINWETSKNALAGFVTGLGGLLALPIAIPSDMFASWVIQARLSATIAIMYGHNISDDRVRTFVIATICGDSVKEVIKNIGSNVAQGLAKKMIKEVPAAALRQINKTLGVKLLTKAGTKGLINLVKVVPVLGGIVGGAFDATYCKTVGKRAKAVFGEFSFHN